MEKFHKTMIFTVVFCLVAIIVAGFLQIQTSNNLVVSCSYLDPVIVDVLAFSFAIFLIVEGGYRIYDHPNDSLKKQLTRIIRVVFGFTIVTLHLVQVFYKVAPLI